MDQLPAITPAQIGALLELIVTQAIAWGWITNDAGQRLVSVGGILCSIAWKLADAYLRGQRVKALAANPNVVTTPASQRA